MNGKTGNDAQQAETFLRAWTASIAARDVAAARQLRSADYRCITPEGSALSLDEDLANIAALDPAAAKIDTRLVAAGRDGARMRLAFDLVAPTWGETAQSASTWRCHMALVEQDGAWRAAALAIGDELPSKPSGPARLRGILRHLARKVPRRRTASRGPGFQELAYEPYLPGQDHACREAPRRTGCTTRKRCPSRRANSGSAIIIRRMAPSTSRRCSTRSQRRASRPAPATASSISAAARGG